MISVDKISVDFGGKVLLDEISFLINDKEKIALVGKNGAGKTTLLNLLSGKMSATSGNVSKPKNLSVGYLPQNLNVIDNKSVFEETKTAFEHIFTIKQNIDDLTNELLHRNDYESTEYHHIIDKIELANEQLKFFESNNIEGEIEKTLTGLGFVRGDFNQKTAKFSGGWRMRIELAKILLQNPDLLLLDEPTNHLDIDSIVWLERFLANTHSAVVLVSHDKAFLDRTTARTIEISLGKIYDYKANYTKFLELKQEKRQQQIRGYENQQKMIADTKEFIERFRYKPTKAVQVQMRIKQLEKLKPIEIDLEDNSRLRLKFPPAPHSGVLPVNIESLTKKYGEKTILQNVNLQIHRGEKIAFVGKNGEGKTTLVKCIMNEVDFYGQLKIGHNVKIGYFAQNQASFLDEQKSIFQTIDDIATGEARTKIRSILGSFMFGREDIDKRVAVLSGGERSRLAMICLLLKPVNLLILDEPTNHLDISSKNILKEAVKNFTGTVLIVSHDRDFLDGLVDKVYEFSNQNLREYIGGIDEYLKEKNFNSHSNVDLRQKEPKDTDKQAVSESRINYDEQKEQEKKLRKQEKLIKTAENEITRFESELTALENDFSQGNSTPEKLDKYQKIKHLIEQKMYEWEILCKELQ